MYVLPFEAHRILIEMDRPTEGGRSGKGMISWKSELKPLEMAQVSSYVLSFQGTTPAEPKDAEGDLWVDPEIQE